MKTRILSSNLDSTTYVDCYESILKHLSEGQNPVYITVNNVHTVVEGVLNPDYGKIINEGFMAVPDGRPLSVVAGLKGDKKMERVFGPTLQEKLLEWGQEDELRHYFVGGTSETLDKMEDVVAQRYPSALVCGRISPPFRVLTKKENDSIVDQINNACADIIWVGLGAPKQERWMYGNYSALHKGIMIGVGAGFDYLAGNIQHAPTWMKKYSLEWFYRLIQEPKRLWRRYVVTIPIFLVLNTLELLRIKKFDCSGSAGRGNHKD